MSEAHWKRCDDTILGLEADFEPKCIFCNTEMESLSSNLLNFATDFTKLDVLDSYAVDIDVICPKCGWSPIFGVAIDKEHHRELEKIGHKQLEETAQVLGEK